MGSPGERPDEPRSARRRARYRRRAAILLVLASLVIGIPIAFTIRSEGAAFLGGDRGPEGVAGISSGPRSTEPAADIPEGPQQPDGSRRSVVGSREASEEERDTGTSKDVSEDASEEPLDVLVLGVDKRPSDSEEDQEIAGVRSDTMMVVRIEPGTGDIKLLSIPRDLLVEVGSGQDRINAAYAYGGIEGARAAVEGLTGISVDNYAVVDFEGFEEVIDDIGGVEVDVDDELPPKYGIEDGPQTLNGRQALFYARYRGTPGGDLDRIEHQQQLVRALRDQALGWNTITKLPGIVKATNENVETDLGFWKAISLGRTLTNRGRDAEVTSVRLEGTPETLPNGAQVLAQAEATNEEILGRFRGR